MLARLVVRRPGWVLLVALAISAALAPLAARLRLDTDLARLLPAGRPEVDAFARFARSFATEQVLLILVESDEPSRLQPFADQLGDALTADTTLVADARWRLRGSAATVFRDHLLGLLTVDEIDKLAPRFRPDAMPAAARRIRALLSAPGGSSLTPIVTADPLDLLPTVAGRISAGLPVNAGSGYFISPDGKALLMQVRPHAAASNPEADRALITRASELAQKFGAHVASDGNFTGHGLEVGFTGACAYTLTYRDWMHRDLLWTTPASLLVVFLLFAFFFRSLRILVFVAPPLMLAIYWTAASTAGLFGTINIVSVVFGPVLASIGIDFPIQIYNRLREELASAEPHQALEKSVAAMALPSLVATLGPALVFFACGLSHNTGLRQLGILAGLGLCLNLVAMLTVLPALLALLPSRLWAKAAPPPRWGLRALDGLANLASRRPRRMVAVVLLLAVAAVPLALRLRFGEKLVTIHPAAMPPVRTEARLSSHFGEREHMLLALVEDKDGELALERSDAWAAQGERLRAAGVLRGVQSLSSLFPSQATQTARRSRLDTVGAPATADALERALAEADFDTAAFAPFIAQLRAAQTIRISDARNTDLSFLLDNHLHDDSNGRRIATFFFPAPGRAAEAEAALTAFSRGPAGGVLTGSTIIDRELREVVLRDTLVLTLASTAGVALLLALVYRRWRSWLAVFAPLSIAWLWFAAALGAVGLPLTLFNLIAVPLVIGYGIDDHVFLLHRYQEPGGDLQLALRSTGRAIILTSVSTIAGFASAAVARFDAIRSFGLSGALAVLVCLVAALAILPALLSLLRPPK
jgi:predicted RND superfamily exporter protein